MSRERIKENEGKKRRYGKPRIENIQIDRTFSMVMLTDPPDDPPGSIDPLHFMPDPFKLPRL
jgi:hypothetical protein